MRREIEHVDRWLEQRPGAGLLARASMACPGCDAPVAPPAGASPPTTSVACPYCRRAGRLREFLSFAAPVRPARVVVRVVAHASPAAPAGA